MADLALPQQGGSVKLKCCLVGSDRNGARRFLSKERSSCMTFRLVDWAFTRDGL